MTPHQEDRQSNLKMGKGAEQTFLLGGHIEDPQIHKKKFNITRYQRDAN